MRDAGRRRLCRARGITLRYSTNWKFVATASWSRLSACCRWTWSAVRTAIEVAALSRAKMGDAGPRRSLSERQPTGIEQVFKLVLRRTLGRVGFLGNADSHSGARQTGSLSPRGATSTNFTKTPVPYTVHYCTPWKMIYKDILYTPLSHRCPHVTTYPHAA